MTTIPRHVALVPDGNRRWARKVEDSFGGHSSGAQVLPEIVAAASDLGIQFLTVYGFSTENWNRPEGEVALLLQILENYLVDNRERMVADGVRFDVIGDLARFPASIRDQVALTKEDTCKGEGLGLQLALNYGGRDEIKRVFQKLATEGVSPSEITESAIISRLDTAPCGDPDLLIRTGGERRFSNFLLWQLAYTEIYFTDVLWPDFTPRDLLDAVLDFQKRTRRMGR